MTATYTKLINWLNAITPNDCTIIVSNPSAPQPPAPFVTIKVITNRDVAVNKTGVDDDGIRKATRFTQLTVSLQIQGKSTIPLQAETIAQQIMDGLNFPEQMLDYFGRDLAFTRLILSPQTLDKISLNEWDNRVVMDIGFSATREILQDVGVIEIVEVDGTIGTIEIHKRIKI